MTTSQPYEYRPRPAPEHLELCGRCQRGLVYRRGPEQRPYCMVCGCEQAGHVYHLAATAAVPDHDVAVEARQETR